MDGGIDANRLRSGTFLLGNRVFYRDWYNVSELILKLFSVTEKAQVKNLGFFYVIEVRESFSSGSGK